MGEALITRRGGGFDIAGICELQACHLDMTASDTDGMFSIPDTIEMSEIKAYIVYSAYTTGGVLSIYDSEGKCIIQDNTGFGDTLRIDVEKKTVETYRHLNIGVGCTILY